MLRGALILQNENSYLEKIAGNAKACRGTFTKSSIGTKQSHLSHERKCPLVHTLYFQLQ